MRENTRTYEMAVELDKYLTANGNFHAQPESAVSKDLLCYWAQKFEMSLRDDIKSTFYKIDLDILSSEIELSADNEEGGPAVFFHRATLRDADFDEGINVNIKILIDYHRTEIYLDSIYAMTNIWKGKSKPLAQIFMLLKTADKHPGYFHPLRWSDFLK